MPVTKYKPRLSHKEIEENHKRFTERISLYKGKGLSFAESRQFILEKACPLDGSILEIGTGTGYTTLALARTGYRCISIDTDREALKTASLNLVYENLLSNVEFYVMDGKSITFRDRSFRNVVCVNLFHHVNKVDKMLSEIDRVLCADGKAVLADFNKAGMEIVDTVHKQEKHMHENSNVTEDSICSYFRGLGYEVQDYEDKYHWLLIAKKLIIK